MTYLCISLTQTHLHWTIWMHNLHRLIRVFDPAGTQEVNMISFTNLESWRSIATCYRFGSTHYGLGTSNIEINVADSDFN